MAILSKLLIVMLYLLKKIPVNLIFGSWIISTIKQCFLWWRKSVKNKSLWVGILLDLLSSLMIHRLIKFSPSTAINQSFWSLMSSTIINWHYQLKLSLQNRKWTQKLGLLQNPFSILNQQLKQQNQNKSVLSIYFVK